MHGSATTTAADRAAIRASGDSIRALAARFGVNPKTVAKWRSRASVDDLPMGPRRRPRRVLTPEEEAMCVAFRKHALLPLDDCLYALQVKLPGLSRSGLHRLYRRHGISRLPDIDETRPRDGGGPAEAARRPPIGDFYIDTAAVRTGDGKVHMYVAFDRCSKFAHAELYDDADRRNAADFLAKLIAAVPYRIHTVLTSDGAEFADPPAAAAGRTRRAHPFGRMCRDAEIVHRLAPPNHPWTIGGTAPAARPAEPESRRRPHYESRDRLREHFFAFFDVYNFTRRLKTLQGRTPYEFICDCWRAEPERFRTSPVDETPRLRTE